MSRWLGGTLGARSRRAIPRCDKVSGIALAFSLANATERRVANLPSPATSIIREISERRGDRCFEELNGLFSGLLIDRQPRARVSLQ